MNEAQLLIATTNEGKKKEIEKTLSSLPLTILSLADLNITSQFPETGIDFLENARGKSLFYGQKWGGLTLGEDSGLEIGHLNGEPGVFSARFSGPGSTDKTNNDKVLRLMKGIPFAERQAKFVSCMVLSENGAVMAVFRGEVEGYISLDSRGKGGFGYDPLFYYPPLKKTFGGMRPEEKNRVSHRGRALVKLRTFLEEHLGASS